MKVCFFFVVIIFLQLFMFYLSYAERSPLACANGSVHFQYIYTSENPTLKTYSLSVGAIFSLHCK